MGLAGCSRCRAQTARVLSRSLESSGYPLGLHAQREFVPQSSLLLRLTLIKEWRSSPPFHWGGLETAPLVALAKLGSAARARRRR